MVSCIKKMVCDEKDKCDDRSSRPLALALSSRCSAAWFCALRQEDATIFADPGLARKQLGLQGRPKILPSPNSPGLRNVRRPGFFYQQCS